MKVRGADDVGGGVRGGGEAPAARTRTSSVGGRIDTLRLPTPTHDRGLALVGDYKAALQPGSVFH